MAPNDPVIHRTLDIRDTAPGLLWTRVKLQLEKLGYGEHLAVQVSDPFGIEQIPLAARREGHQVREVHPIEGGYEIVIERGRQDFARAYLGAF